MGKTLKLNKVEDNGSKYSTKNVSSLLLTKNKTFEQHIAELNSIDEKKDDAGRKMLLSTQHLIDWVNIKDEYDKAFSQIAYFVDTLQDEISQQQFLPYYKKFEVINREKVKDETIEEEKIYKNKEKIKKLLAEPDLAVYRRWFDYKYFRMEHHRIDAIEKIAQEASWGVKPLNDICATLMTELDGEITDSKGKVIEDMRNLTIQQINDETVWQTYYIADKKGSSHYFNTLTQLMYLKFKRVNQELGWLEFNSRFEKNMHAVEIKPELGLEILKTSSLFKDIFCRFRQIVDKLIGKQLHRNTVKPWFRDRNLYFPKIEVTPDEAVKDARKSLSILGDEYIAIFDRIIDEKWIHWKEDKGEQDDCSFGSRGGDKFPIILNWNKQTEAVMTIVHESGHSINNVLSKSSGIHSGVVRLIAEIPAFVNEALLLCYYINKKYAKNPKGYYFTLLYYYLKRLEENICKNVAYELSCFAIENFFKQNNEFKFDDILKIYRESRNRFGGLTSDERKWLSSKSLESIYDWNEAFTVFYSYDSYKTILYFLGAVVGTSIGLDLYYYPDETVDKYIEFLKKGNTSDPVKALKELGYDITDPNTYKRLAEWLNKLVDIFAKCNFKDPTALPKESEELAEKHSVDDYIYKILSGK